jgi:Polyphosphate kinase 2 (PPK2)
MKNSKTDLSKKDYLEKLEPLQLELNQMARWLQATGKRLLVIIEGRDTAGKGGVIAAISRSGTFSAMCPFCRRPARSRCSTAVGTTAPASSR